MNDHLPKAAFLLFFVLAIITRVRIYNEVNLVVVDSDQPFLWIGAKDFSEGIFNEPRFYGQNYNTFMESFFAVPLIWAGLKVYQALPIATHFIALFPFFFSAMWLYRKKKIREATVVLGVLLCLPAAYDIVTGIPRGFVTGLFFSSLLIISLHNQRSHGLFALNVILSVFGYFVHSNSVFVTAPVLFYVFLHNLREPKFHLVTAISLVSILPAHLFFNKFYNDHPEYIMYGLRFIVAPQNFIQNVTHLVTEGLQHVTFFGENNRLALAAVLILVSGLLLRHITKAAISFLLMLLLIVLSCILDKTRDGSSSAFYSFSRMFLALPIGIALFSTLPEFKSRAIYVCFVSIVLAFSILKQITFKQEVAPHIDQSRWAGVARLKLPDALNVIDFYKKVSEQQNLKTIISSNLFWMSTMVCYGGPALYDDYPETMESNYEHRYKVRERLLPKVIPEFLFLSDDFEIDRKLDTTHFRISKIDHYGMFRVSQNSLTTREFIATITPIEMKNREK